MTPTEEAVLHRAIAGALRDAINSHGYIRHDQIGSTTKRVLGSVEAYLATRNSLLSDRDILASFCIDIIAQRDAYRSERDAIAAERDRLHAALHDTYGCLTAWKWNIADFSEELWREQRDFTLHNARQVLSVTTTHGPPAA